MAIDGARIQRITREGLFYLDDERQEKFISFALCHLNYVMEFVDRSQRYSREERQEGIQRRRGHKCVADRNAVGGYPLDIDLPWTQFYTDPPILFEFATYEDFQNLQRALLENGWTSYDRG